MATLLDQYGQPIRPATLTEEVSGARMVGLRPAVVPTDIGPLSPELIGRTMRAADQGDSLMWQILAEEIERRDPHYLSVLNTRKLAISQLPITVTPASSDAAHVKHADFVRGWVERGILRRSLYDQMDALAKGFSVHEMEWHMEAGNYWPAELTFRPQRWFDISMQDGETIMIRDDCATPALPSVADGIPQPGFRNMEPYKFVTHRHAAWSGLTIRGGLTRAAIWPVMFKLFTNRDWALFVQNYGLPMRVGKYTRDASDNDRKVLLRAVSDIAGGAGCTIPDSMQIEFPEPKTASSASDIHERRFRILNEELSKLVLGQTGTTESKQGAHASGQVHREVQVDIERADTFWLSYTATTQCAIPMVSCSFGPQDAYPVITIGRPDEAPFDDVIKALQFGGPQGLKVRCQDIYDRLSLTPPEDGDAVCGIIAQPQPVEPAHVLPAQDRAPQDMPARVSVPTTQSPQEPDQQNTLHAALGRLVARHAREEPHMVALLTNSLAHAAQPILDDMIIPVRRALMQAKDMEDFRQRLGDMELSPAAFAQAMAQGMAAANLAGELMVLDEIGRDPAGHG
ncbi:DUF935 domain-containing protein [Komagataeibacter kakiaceti JCM 25156]